MPSKQDFYTYLSEKLQLEREQGREFPERPLATPQGAEVTLADGTRLLNLCSNNYLGLGNHPDVVEAAKASLDLSGFGMAGGRLACGTHVNHHVLEPESVTPIAADLESHRIHLHKGRFPVLAPDLSFNA